MDEDCKGCDDAWETCSNILSKYKKGRKQIEILKKALKECRAEANNYQEDLEGWHINNIIDPALLEAFPQEK